MTSLEAAVNEWVDYLRVEKGASSHTVSNYRRDALRYARDLEERGVRSLAEVSARDIEDYTMRLASGEVTGTPAAASSVARASAAIRGLHKYALMEGLVGVDPAAQLRAPRAGRHLPKALTVDEVGRLLDVAHANDSSIGLRDCALLELLYATGARVSEAVALSADDLDLDGDVPVVRLFGKGRKERIVPVGSFAVEALGAYRVRARPALAARGRGSTAFFLNSRGGPLSRQSAWTAIRRAAQAADLGDKVCRTRCDTHLPPTCWRVGRACARSKSSSDMPQWRPRRYIRRSRPPRCARFLHSRTPGRVAPTKCPGNDLGWTRDREFASDADERSA